ncbi:MAG: hypothetical protein K0S74_1889, partial [Chlamydiales bacterium]|nr:hypothetical protein [Chlamydiales bacterium]
MSMFVIVGILFNSFFIYTNEIESLAVPILQYQSSFPEGNLQNVDTVKAIIDVMYEVDQDLRKKLIHDIDNIKLRNLVKEIDCFHTNKMKEILTVHGWINISKFGKEYDQKAWLLVQHADHDPFFQAGSLFILSQLMLKNETDAKNYAYLYDRVVLKFQQLGMLQKFGTQVDVKKNGSISLLPYEGDLEDVEGRRKEIGLNSLTEYMESI